MSKQPTPPFPDWAADGSKVYVATTRGIIKNATVVRHTKTRLFVHYDAGQGEVQFAWDGWYKAWTAYGTGAAHYSKPFLADPTTPEMKLLAAEQNRRSASRIVTAAAATFGRLGNDATPADVEKLQSALGQFVINYNALTTAMGAAKAEEDSTGGE